MNIKPFFNAITRSFGRSSLLASKFSPEVLTAVGIVGVIGTTVMASRATLKLSPIVDEIETNLEKIDAAAKANPVAYDSDARTKDRVRVYTRAVVDVAKLYGPTVLIGTAAIACLIGSNRVLRNRNIALAAAYTTLDKAFKTYRKRVVESFGDDVDQAIMYDGRPTTVDVENSEGKKEKEKAVEVFRHPDGRLASPYARFFDQMSKRWDQTPELNLHFLRWQQSYLNDILQSRGHLFLNEVYDALGIPRTQAGQVVGWHITKGGGDNFVDFGVYDIGSEACRRFVNGDEDAILLDFNVDGVIHDLI